MKFWSNFTALAIHSLRDKMDIFFNLFFPAMTLIVLGFVFSGIYNAPTVKVGITGNVPKIEGVSFKSFENISMLKKAVAKHDVDFGVSLSSTLLNVYLNPSNAQSNEYYISLGKKIAAILNKEKGTTPVIKVTKREVSFSEQKLSYLDTLIPGILALSIFSAGIFSMTASLAHLRDKKIIRKLWTTPLFKWHFYGAFILESVVKTYISILLLLLVAVITFGVHYHIQWVNFSILLLSSTFGMMGIGMIILLFSPSAKIASEISSVIYTIVMFFSGVYFPVEIMPKSMQKIAYSLPVIYIVNAMKYVFGLRPMSSVSFYGMIFLMFAGFVLILIGFGKLFKVE
ncbi:ABC transporter permease [Mesoaciditoga lauensis]|uniref:ABC transporter permease n=1 Tax=Mesoaciditoga lauensis TaxID=1495039 RepID=UPI0005602FC6|nr:ABC transporter permease [Mesoaciditoga lauensis]